MKKTLSAVLAISCMAYADNVTIDSAATVTVPGSDASWSSPSSNNQISIAGGSTNTANLVVTDSIYGQYINGGSLNNITTVNVEIKDGAAVSMNWNNNNGAYNPTTSDSATHTVTLGVGSQLNTPNGYTKINGNTAEVNMGEGSSISAKNLELNANSTVLNMVAGSTINATDTISVKGGSSLTINMGEGASITSTNQITLNSLGTALTLNTASVEQQIIAAVAAGSYYDRTLISSTNQTIWYSNGNGAAYNTLVSLHDSVLDAAGYQNLGILYTTDNGQTFTNKAGEVVALNGKQYALAFFGAEGCTYAGKGAPSSMHLIATPEPATATLSLLALAGLMARRRRH